MEPLLFKIVQNINEAREIRISFTKNENIYQNRDFRSCFFDYMNYDILFYVWFLDTQIIGVLPLQRNKNTSIVEFFWWDFMEDNKVLININFTNYVPLFYKKVKEDCLKTEMDYISDKNDLLVFSDYSYYVNLKGMSNEFDLIERYFPERSKKKMRRKIKKFDETYSVDIKEDFFDDLDVLIQLNKKVFWEESVFSYKYSSFWYAIKNLMNSSTIKKHMCSFYINGIIRAVTFSIIYGDSYIGLSSGIDKDTINRDVTK